MPLALTPVTVAVGQSYKINIRIDPTVGAIPNPVKGVIVNNQTGYTLTVSGSNGTQTISACVTAYVPIDSMATDSLAFSVAASGVNFGVNTVYADAVFTQDPTPLGYPISGLASTIPNNVSINNTPSVAPVQTESTLASAGTTTSANILVVGNNTTRIWSILVMAYTQDATTLETATLTRNGVVVVRMPFWKGVGNTMCSVSCGRDGWAVANGDVFAITATAHGDVFADIWYSGS